MRYDSFQALTFDCYGTLIDWEAGLLSAFRPLLEAHGARAGEEDLLARYARQEAELEAGPYRPYRQVVRDAGRGVAAELGVEPSPQELETFAGSVGDWPPFADSADALARLSERFRLAVITNCDDDLFERSRRRLGVDFDVVVTAEQVGSYKPDERGFRVALDRIGLPVERVLHVAQSLYHDHVPAGRIGLSSVWIDRRRGRVGSGATPPAEASPGASFPDMASFATAATA